MEKHTINIINNTRFTTEDILTQNGSKNDLAYFILANKENGSIYIAPIKNGLKDWANEVCVRVSFNGKNAITLNEELE